MNEEAPPLAHFHMFRRHFRPVLGPQEGPRRLLGPISGGFWSDFPMKNKVRAPRLTTPMLQRPNLDFGLPGVVLSDTLHSAPQRQKLPKIDTGHITPAKHARKHIICDPGAVLASSFARRSAPQGRPGHSFWNPGVLPSVPLQSQWPSQAPLQLYNSLTTASCKRVVKLQLRPGAAQRRFWAMCVSWCKTIEFQA